MQQAAPLESIPLDLVSSSDDRMSTTEVDIDLCQVSDARTSTVSRIVRAIAAPDFENCSGWPVRQVAPRQSVGIPIGWKGRNSLWFRPP